jgi:hypothetical protein
VASGPGGVFHSAGEGGVLGPTISEEDPTIIGAVSRSVQERFGGMGCSSDDAEVIGMAYVRWKRFEAEAVREEEDGSGSSRRA